MRVLITAGPTREPIDAVRYLSNRSSGRMGAALITAALQYGHSVTAVVGPINVPLPTNIQRIDVETSAEMQRAVSAHFPDHDLLIMAAAVSDYRPRQILDGKIPSGDALILQLEPTQDIIALASGSKRSDQRTVAFSLESAGGIDRAREKMLRKNVDLTVFNPTTTMDSPTVQAVLLYPNGRSEELACREKADFADILLQRAVALF
jgi:phosphopantothenoylcysteine decarboxylase/phosphopantothenate--cysteine ligase